MLQRGAQIRLGMFGLSMQAGLDFLQICLDGRKKGDGIQADYFQLKSRKAFSLVAAATASVVQEWSNPILSAIRRT